MAIAKNFVLHGIWGVTKYEFSSSSSSILWTLSLSLIFYFFRPNTFAPLILNLFFASSLVFIIYKILLKEKLGGIQNLAILISIILLTPLVPLIFTGLEHVFHICISILFIYLIAEIGTGNGRKWMKILSVICSIMLPLLRYEGFVLVLVGGVALFINKKPAIAIFNIVSPILPVTLFGIHSIEKGWSFFPNSMLLKGEIPDITGLNDIFSFTVTLSKILFSPVNLAVLVIVLLSIFFFAFYYRKKNAGLSERTKKNLILFLLWAVNVCLFYIYSKSGWSYRYQSFLVSITLFISGIVLVPYLKFNLFKTMPALMKIGFVISVLIFISGCIFQTFVSLNIHLQTPRATTNIYEQQYQMSAFLKRFYDNDRVALNDIGASNYFTDIVCTDLWGLSDLEISRLRRNHSISEIDIDRITRAKNVSIAIVYDSWFRDDNSSIIPVTWYKAGEWVIQDNVIAGDSVISFYSVNPQKKNELIDNLRSFSGLLPPRVIQRGEYEEK